MNNPSKAHKVAIALGANIGGRLKALRAGARGVADYMSVTAKSPVYETPPVYVVDQPPFLNAAVIGETKLAPLVLLRALKDLESDLGRMPTFHYGPRVIDIDIVFYGDEIVNQSELMIPHPRVSEREFVLRPLADIAPDWRHPETKLTVAEMLAQLENSAAKKLTETL